MQHTDIEKRIILSRNYEQACQAIMHCHREVLGYGRVEGSKRYPGKRSRAKNGRQIDVTIHLVNGEYILVECKQWNKKLNVSHVESFDAKVCFDIGYERAMMVSVLGFTESAINYAKSRNILLVTLNSHASLDEYVMKMDAYILLGFVEGTQVSDQANICVIAEGKDTTEANDIGSLQEIL